MRRREERAAHIAEYRDGEAEWGDSEPEVLMSTPELVERMRRCVADQYELSSSPPIGPLDFDARRTLGIPMPISSWSEEGRRSSPAPSSDSESCSELFPSVRNKVWEKLSDEETGGRGRAKRSE